MRDDADNTFLDPNMKSGMYITEIVKRFSDEIEITKHNLRLADSLPYAKEGRLGELLEALFGNESKGE